MKQDPDNRGRTLGSEPVFGNPPQTVGNAGLLEKNQDMNTQLTLYNSKDITKEKNE
jgi:hypothetical protein